MPGTYKINVATINRHEEKVLYHARIIFVVIIIYIKSIMITVLQ